MNTTNKIQKAEGLPQQEEREETGFVINNVVSITEEGKSRLNWQLKGVTFKINKTM